jgi:hypothetical protein
MVAAYGAMLYTQTLADTVFTAKHFGSTSTLVSKMQVEERTHINLVL